MPTKGFILAIRAIKAIGAIMTTLEIINEGISLGRGTNSARAGMDYQDKAFGNLGGLLNTGNIGSIGNGGQIGISAGQGHTYNRQRVFNLGGRDYEDGIYIGNANNQGHWGNNANTGNNANDGISLGRGTRSRRAGMDYADEGIYIGNTGNQGNWGNNDNIGNNANEGISLGRGTNSRRSGMDYLSIKEGLDILDKTPVKSVKEGLDIYDSVKGSGGGGGGTSCPCQQEQGGFNRCKECFTRIGK